MSVPPESIQVGQCYLAEVGKTLQIRRVVRVLPDGRVQYERRVKTPGPNPGWAPGVAGGRAFTEAVVREVPCDWSPETDKPEA